MDMRVPDVVRKVVLYGDADPSLRINKPTVAHSECRIVCDDDEIIDRCVEQLRLSDEHLRNRPEELMLWDWSMTYVDRIVGSNEPGGVVVLGVNWYDMDFFDIKKDVYTNSAHLAKYLGIGLKPGAITVKHWRFAGEGKF